MGGYGSTRWRWHTRKATVEESLRVPIKLIHRNLRPGYWGSINWSVGERKTNSISYQVEDDEKPVAIRFIYTQTSRSTGAKTDLDYRVPLTTTPLPWGGVRYWFKCTLSKNGVYCGRRVGVIYLPTGYQYFGCRHCYELTYRSCQESHNHDSLYIALAAMMQDVTPGANPADMRYLLEKGMGEPPPGGYYERQYLAILEELKRVADFDPWSDWLSATELCVRSGLTPAQLAELEAARLLVSDHGGRYRPKLAGWGRKLAYLLGEGWNLSEIKAWSFGRWSTANPRQFPPELAAWRV